MPLGFQSLSHGSVAFGFFNIETDLLLLEHYFFFAGEFCQYISIMADDKRKGTLKYFWRVYAFPNREEIGDLMGAIHGIRYTGFIGEVYRKFPFPLQEELFKQHTDGWKNREPVAKMLSKYASLTEIPIIVDQEEGEVRIGIFLFSEYVFQELIRYVWLGGYPRWKDGVPPDYVKAMKAGMEKSEQRLFSALQLV